MTESDMPRVVALTGVTAVGKTQVALALADRRSISIISMDSTMVYRGMDIGTAKPTAALRERYPHALVDVCDPLDSFSVANFLEAADAAVREAWQAGRLPVLVGGTMLYLQAFRDGLATLPAADPAVRRKIDAEAAAQGWRFLYERLQRLDPLAARKIHPNNRPRLQRALEVYELTGKPISSFWSADGRSNTTARLGAKLLEFAIEPDDRRILHQVIAQRFDAMLAAGFLAEVAALRTALRDLSLPALRAVGYRQGWEHLDGCYDVSEMRERVIIATRQLAKRQLTWLRGWPWLNRLVWGDSQRLADEIDQQLT